MGPAQDTVVNDWVSLPQPLNLRYYYIASRSINNPFGPTLMGVYSMPHLKATDLRANEQVKLSKLCADYLKAHCCYREMVTNIKRGISL